MPPASIWAVIIPAAVEIVKEIISLFRPREMRKRVLKKQNERALRNESSLNR